MDMWDLLKSAIPNDHSRQVTSEYYIDEILRNSNKIINVLDLGCGNAGSLNYFINKNPKINWIGVDIELPWVELKNEVKEKINIYNGINLPFKEKTFDLIYSNQALEHVKHPRELLLDVHRVLKDGGVFIGSVSQLEPYHALSLWNYTPVGFKILMEELNFNVIELRPSIDALTLIIRRLLGRPQWINRYWGEESPLNKLISLVGFLQKKKHDRINLEKLLFCGQFVFMVRKQGLTDGNEKTR